MRIITLNTWGGRAGKEKLLSFFQTYREETDIFCLQEIWAAPYEHLEGAMAGGSALKHEDIMVHAGGVFRNCFRTIPPFFIRIFWICMA